MAITFIEGFDSYPVESSMNHKPAHWQRPHHEAREHMEDLIVGLFRDDMVALEHKAPEPHPDWLSYYDSVMLARLEMVGKALGWEAPAAKSIIPTMDDLALVNKWKPTYHVMRAILLAEITNQLMASERFNHLLDQYSDKMNTGEARKAFNPPESVK